VRIGDVIEKRRLVEPIFGELKEREAMIGPTLAEYEAAQSSKSLEQQLLELTETQSAQYLSIKGLERRRKTKSASSEGA
jgi:hypothetical protein